MSLYLSKLTPNLRSAKARRDLENPYDLHRTLSRGVAQEDERLLWRVDGQNQINIIVQTLHKPDWSYLVEDVPPSYLKEAPASKAVDLAFAQGQTLTFHLRANPTVKRTVGNKKKRLALYDLDEQLEWLQRKAEQGGFALLSVTPLQQETLQAKRDSQTMTLHAVTFQGRLVVEEPAAFLATLKAGVGSAKGFGMGLLSIAKG